MNIGSKIRDIRIKKGITLTQMSEGTNLSKGFISQVENNKTSPSIATAEMIANFLQIPLPYLLLEKRNDMKIIRKKERMFQHDEGDLLEFVAQMEGLRLTIVKISTGTFNQSTVSIHQGIECHLILKGVMEVTYGEETVILEEGDSFSWHACVPHQVRNIGNEEAIILIASYKDV